MLQSGITSKRFILQLTCLYLTHSNRTNHIPLQLLESNPQGSIPHNELIAIRKAGYGRPHKDKPPGVPSSGDNPTQNAASDIKSTSPTKEGKLAGGKYDGTAEAENTGPLNLLSIGSSLHVTSAPQSRVQSGHQSRAGEESDPVHLDCGRVKLLERCIRRSLSLHDEECPSSG